MNTWVVFPHNYVIQKLFRKFIEAIFSNFNLIIVYHL